MSEKHMWGTKIWMRNPQFDPRTCITVLSLTSR